MNWRNNNWVATVISAAGLVTAGAAAAKTAGKPRVLFIAVDDLVAGAYTDMNVGRLLDAFEKSPQCDNTIIVLWGDHEWSLGEKQRWRKFALWEEPTRAPLIWVAPGVTTPGTICDQPVDFLSIYPTLCDLAGLSIPIHVEGKSLRSLLKTVHADWSEVAISTQRG